MTTQSNFSNKNAKHLVVEILLNWRVLRRNRLFASGHYQGDCLKALSAEFEDNRVIENPSKAQSRESSSLSLSMCPHGVTDKHHVGASLLVIPAVNKIEEEFGVFGIVGYP